VAIVGIESLVYGVDDVGICTKFFDDFGLPLLSRTDSTSTFQLDEGSKVVLRHRNDPAPPVLGTGRHRRARGYLGPRFISQPDTAGG